MIDYALTWEPGLTLAMIKAEAIRQALEHYQGDKTQAARALGMGLRTLRIWVADRPELESYRIAGHRTQLPQVEQSEALKALEKLFQDSPPRMGWP